MHRAAFLAAVAGVVHVIVLVTIEGLALSHLTVALAASVAFALVITAGPIPWTATVRREGHKRDVVNIVSHISKASAFFLLALIAVLVVLRR